jgi:hypothetical protein
MVSARSTIAIATILCTPVAAVSASLAADSGGGFSEAKLIGIVDGKEVYINKKQASINEVARRGGTVGTGGKSRARILFDPKVTKDNIGLLKPNTRITVGSRSFHLEDGEIWVDGPQNGCAGSATIRVKGTSYVLARINGDTSRVSVMNGEALLTRDSDADDSASPASPAKDGKSDTGGRFPSFSPIFGIGASAYTSNSGGVPYGESSALVLGEVNFYAPSGSIRYHDLSIRTPVRAVTLTDSGVPVRNWATVGIVPPGNQVRASSLVTMVSKIPSVFIRRLP